MLFSFASGAKFTLFTLVSLTNAQQYAGEVIENSLPSVSGSELAYFNIASPDGDTSVPLTFMNYMSLNSTNQRLVNDDLQRAVIIIHGLLRDPYLYIADMMSALAENPHDEVNADTVALCAPYFPNGNDENIGFPYSESEGSNSSALVWHASDWADGGNNKFPSEKKKIVSSYEVLDQLVEYYADLSLFPNMKQIVVAGHSLGAQAVQRYAAVGNVLDIAVPVSYWVANPNSLLWLSDKRPLDYSDCDVWDDWKNGLSNYQNTYGAELVASGRENVLALYNSRTIAYGRGTRDLGDDSSDCGPQSTGQTRNERFFNFIWEFPPTCNSTTSCSTIDYVNTGHNAEVMFSDPSGQARLFTDNWSGNGTRAYDSGYPRLQTGDDPFPNPAYEGEITSPDMTVMSGGMVFEGCYTDSTSDMTLSYTAYTNSSNTPQMCTAACVEAGYLIAGTEYGTECYCGNEIGSSAIQVVYEGCKQACGGNSSAICGDSNRISIYCNGWPPGGSAIPLGASS